MKLFVKKTDFYGIVLFIVFILWNLITYFVYEKDSYLGRMLNAAGLMVLLLGESVIKCVYNKGQVIGIRRIMSSNQYGKIDIGQ